MSIMSKMMIFVALSVLTVTNATNMYANYTYENFVRDFDRNYEVEREKVFLLLALILFIINFLISFFHSLVERGFVNYSSSCASNNNNFEDIESLRQSLENTPIAKCDEIIFSVMGLSLANINLIVLTLLIIINILFVVRNDKT